MPQSFLLAAGALNTRARNGYTAQGVSLTFPFSVLLFEQGIELSVHPLEG